MAKVLFEIGVYSLIVPKTPDELRQVLMPCTCGELRKTARAITQLYDHMLEPSGLLITQLAMLRNIPEGGAETISHLAEKLSMDRTTLTRNLAPLEKQGFIKISTGKDKRMRLVALTEKGSRAKEKAVPLWEEVQRQVIKQLGEKKWRKFMGELSEVLEIARKSSSV